MRRAARIDKNQPDIVDAMRAAGATVWHIKLPVDLLVGVGGRTALVECKGLIGKRHPKASGYTTLQEEFMSTWQGGPVATITDVDGALRLIAMMRSEP